ncbi:unnamed protein product, partial [Hapterophycus canaliculatus]
HGCSCIIELIPCVVNTVHLSLAFVSSTAVWKRTSGLKFSARCDSLHCSFVKVIACTVESVQLYIGQPRKCCVSYITSSQAGCVGLHRRAAVVSVSSVPNRRTRWKGLESF